MTNDNRYQKHLSLQERYDIDWVHQLFFSWCTQSSVQPKAELL